LEHIWHASRHRWRALDLTDATLFEWCLINGDGAQALGPGDAVVTVQTPATAGLVAIVVANAITAGLAPGRYVDALRVTINGPRSTLWRGCILVGADLPDIAWAPAVLSPPSPISLATGSPAIGAPVFVSPGVDQLG
jgi:hypothetical protein